jgi:nucleoside-diphosphate-sugar epimerase
MNHDDTIVVFGSSGMAGSAISEQLRGNGHLFVVKPNRTHADLMNYDSTIDFLRMSEPRKGK